SGVRSPPGAYRCPWAHPPDSHHRTAIRRPASDRRAAQGRKRARVRRREAWHAEAPSPTCCGNPLMLRLLPRLLLLLLALALATPLAAQQPFDVPGLSADTQAYFRELTRRYPAGATAQQRAQAEQRAAQAERQN